MNMHPPAGNDPSDDELQRAWLSEEESGIGEPPFMVIYNRYRVAVHDEMVRAGLDKREAENRVGSVFLRAQDDPEIPPETPLRDRLLTVARKVATDADWTPEL
jgi:hypothetical protein